jgi:hypothetical protein
MAFIDREAIYKATDISSSDNSRVLWPKPTRLVPDGSGTQRHHRHAGDDGRRDVQRQLRDHLLEPRVLVLQLAQLGGLARIEPAEAPPPSMQRAGDAVFFATY